LGDSASATGPRGWRDRKDGLASLAAALWGATTDD
jgi:hypothetical protein